MKVTTTVVGDHQGPGDADAIGAFLLVVGRDSYTTYNLPAAGTLTIGRGESNAVRIDDPLASRAHAEALDADAVIVSREEDDEGERHRRFEPSRR